MLPGLFRLLGEPVPGLVVAAELPPEPRSPTPPACSPTRLPEFRLRLLRKQRPVCRRLLPRSPARLRVPAFPASRLRRQAFQASPPVVGFRAFRRRALPFPVFLLVVAFLVFRRRAPRCLVALPGFRLSRLPRRGLPFRVFLLVVASPVLLHRVRRYRVGRLRFRLPRLALRRGLCRVFRVPEVAVVSRIRVRRFPVLRQSTPPVRRRLRLSSSPEPQLPRRRPRFPDCRA